MGLHGRRKVVFVIIVGMAAACGTNTGGRAAMPAEHPQVGITTKPTPPTPVPSSNAAGLDEQERLDAASAAVETFVRSNRLAGLSDITINIDANRVLIWWVGNVPNSLNDYVSTETTPNAQLEVHPAVHSSAEASNTASALIELHSNRSSGWYIDQVKQSVDGSTLTAYVTVRSDISLATINSVLLSEVNNLYRINIRRFTGGSLIVGPK